MKPIFWHAGRNKHTGEWNTGGTVSDYPAEHWDYYLVYAKNRAEALKLAHGKRRSALTKAATD